MKHKAFKKARPVKTVSQFASYLSLYCVMLIVLSCCVLLNKETLIWGLFSVLRLPSLSVVLTCVELLSKHWIKPDVVVVCVWLEIQHQCSHGNGCLITGVCLVYLQTASLCLFLEQLLPLYFPSLTPPFTASLTIFISLSELLFSGPHFVFYTSQNRFDHSTGQNL